MRLASREFSFSIVLGKTVKSIRGVQSLKHVFEVWSPMWKSAYVFLLFALWLLQPLLRQDHLT